MNILIICDDLVNHNGARHMLPLEGCGATLYYMTYKSGPKSRIEGMKWDLIIVTPNAFKAIGKDAFAADWYQPCITMSKNLIVDNAVIP